MSGLIRLLDFKDVSDKRGTLVALEGERNIPFAIKRVYYMVDVPPGETRGFHAHRKLQQVAVCLNGSCKMVLDDGKTRESVVLDSPTKGLVIGDLVWREMSEFTAGAVLMVLASEPYDEADYIRDHDEFLTIVRS